MSDYDNFCMLGSKAYKFTPLDDITASELAGVLEMAGMTFRGPNYDVVMDRCPGLARHFTVEGETPQ